MKCPTCDSYKNGVEEHEVGFVLVCECGTHIEYLTEEPYVLVDLRSIAGNCVLFWAKGRSGYTCELNEAHVFTAKQAFSQHRCRPDVDQPIPLSVARKSAVTHVRREPLNDWLTKNPDERRQDPFWLKERRERKRAAR